MKDLIANLSNQIREAIEIGENAQFRSIEKNISTVLVCGLGGSGIGGKIVSLLLKDELKLPFLSVNDYDIPEWVNENTLVIASSYSGNTEETLSAVKECYKKGAEVVVITSGGTVLEIAKANQWNHFVVPGGEQPRAMLAYSIVQQLYILTRYNLISNTQITELAKIPDFVDAVQAEIKEEAMRIAQHFVGNTGIIYAGTGFEGIAIRWRQQINENAKELCWHHVFPEMTHNELVGWAGGSAKHTPIFLKTDFDHPRTKERWKISKAIIAKYADNVLETSAKGENRLAQSIYLIHLGDWVSYLMAEIKKIDPVEVNVITHLKGEMAKMG